MSTIPEDLRYTKSHEWVRNDGDGYVTVGISDHAQAALGDLVFIELPREGASFAVGDSCCVVESVKAASDVYCPMAGEISEKNDALVDEPELVNTDPYEGGWLFRLRCEDVKELEQLFDASAYSDFLASEEQ